MLLKNKSCVIVQSGAFGDILTVSTIAAYYANSGYQVFWPAREKYLQPILRLPYVTPILLDEEVRHSDWLRSDAMKTWEMEETRNADLVLDLSDRTGETKQRAGENFEITKYRLAKVPLQLKHTLTWARDEEKEKRLVQAVCPEGDYVFAHLTNSYNDRAAMPKQDLPVVEAQEIAGFDLFDWYQVILGAKSVYAVESSFFHLIDGIVHFLSKKPYILKKAIVEDGARHCLAVHWDHTYIGQTRLTG
jgi:hypothetical protein